LYYFPGIGEKGVERQIGRNQRRKRYEAAKWSEFEATCKRAAGDEIISVTKKNLNSVPELAIRGVTVRPRIEGYGGDTTEPERETPFWSKGGDLAEGKTVWRV